MRPALGTFVEIGAAGSSRSAIDAAVSGAFDVIGTVERLLSFQRRDSDLSRLNASPGEAVPVDPLTVRVLRLACAMTRASAGAFDVTLGGALVLAGVLPDHGGRCLESGDAGDVEILGARTARLRRPVRLTVDGLAKGYAVDLAVHRLERAGLDAGWVNAGGDLRVFGERHQPVYRREPNGRTVCLGHLRRAALATSTVDAQQPRFPGHLIGERSPERGVYSVVAKRAWRADALTKVAALSPPAARAARVRTLGGELLPIGVAEVT